MHLDWDGENIEINLRNWSHNLALVKYKDVSLLVSWGVWLAQNACIFGNRDILPF